MEEVGFEPRLLAARLACPHRAPLSVLSLHPQTVAECVLYYYLTKKNENYKSLVRRSYRRRGKGQVRGEHQAVGPWDRLPACLASAPPLWVPLRGGWDALSGDAWPSPAAENRAGRDGHFVLSLENSRTQLGDPWAQWLKGCIF